MRDGKIWYENPTSRNLQSTKSFVLLVVVVVNDELLYLLQRTNENEKQPTTVVTTNVRMVNLTEKKL